MIVLEQLKRAKGFSITVDEDFLISGISITKSPTPLLEFLGKSIIDLYYNTFTHAKLGNIDLHDQLKVIFDQSQDFTKDVLIPVTKEQEVFYTFKLVMDVIQTDEQKHALITVENFRKTKKLYRLYKDVLEKSRAMFPIFNNLNQVSRLLIDNKHNPDELIIDRAFYSLFDLEFDGEYKRTIVHKDNQTNFKKIFFFDDEFFELLDDLYNNKIDKLVDDFKVNDRWIRIELMVYEYDMTLKQPRLTLGVAYDVTDLVSYSDVKYTQAIYDLAIKSGNIGIYYYNFQKYSEDKFHANDIYANMFGLEPDDEGLYLTSDFVKAVLEIEDEITDEDQTLKILHELFEGSIKGTTDDILKIKHLKTSEIKYLLSSAKVQARYSNGKPKVFGGVVIDITERIKREKIERQKSLYDPLTSLGNNRKLLKDLETANDGVGIFFDLDNFKKINDTHGHLVGDEMIKLYSEILSSTGADIDVYRLYGDEFFVFAEDKDESWAKNYVAKITDISKKKSDNLKYDFVLSASSGRASFTKGDDINEFIKECDYEMYRKKIKKHDKEKR